MSNLLRELAVDAIKMPGVGQRLDFMKMIDEIAQLNGIRYFNKFKLQAMPDGMLAGQAQAGNVIPMGGADGRVGTEGTGGVPGPSQVAGVGPTS